MTCWEFAYTCGQQSISRFDYVQVTIARTTRKQCSATRSQQSRAYFSSFEGEAEEKGLCQTRPEPIRQTTLGCRNPSHCRKKVAHK
jgi:hypothetical protein